MSINNRTELLRYLSDFWVTFYEEHPILETSLKSVSEIVKNNYFRVLQKELPYTPEAFPLFREEFWNIIELDSSQMTLIKKETGEEFFSYPLDEVYAKIPFLYNIIYDPTVRLTEGIDYILQRAVSREDGLDNEDALITSSILFRRKPVTVNGNGDPFYNNNIAKRLSDDNRVLISLFAPKAFIDDQDLNREWGNLLGFYEISSPEYALFLEGLFRLYINGPSIANLNAGLTLASGYPVARSDERVISVEIYVDASQDINEFVLTCESGRKYILQRKVVDHLDNTVSPPIVSKKVYPTLNLSELNGNPNFSDPLIEVNKTYPVEYNLNRLDSFIKDIRIDDTSTNRYWWREKQGRISNNLVENLSEELRRDPDTIDYIFENYLKFNTFGVFIDYLALRKELPLSNRFLDILSEVKPTFKTFLVYEDDLHIVSVMGAGDTLNDDEDGYHAGVKLMYNMVLEDLLYRDIEIHSNYPIQKADIALNINNFQEAVSSDITPSLFNSDYIYYDSGSNPAIFDSEGSIIL